MLIWKRINVNQRQYNRVFISAIKNKWSHGAMVDADCKEPNVF